MRLRDSNVSMVKPAKELEDLWEEFRGIKATMSQFDLLKADKLAKAIIPHIRDKRVSKYDGHYGLRIVFTEKTIHFFGKGSPGHPSKKLGEHPEMTLEMAKATGRARKKAIGSGVTVWAAIAAYEEDRDRKVQTTANKASSRKTFGYKIRKIRGYFNGDQIFALISSGDLQKVMIAFIENETPNYAFELQAELRLIWKYCSPLFSMGRNECDLVPTNFVSGRVPKPQPNRVFATSDAIAIFLNNVDRMPHLQQRNAIKFMIFTGVRPSNVANLKWEHVDDPDNPTCIEYTTYEMKVYRRFKIPLTTVLAELIKEQWEFRSQRPALVNQEYIFVQPTNYLRQFSKSSLTYLVKGYFPVNGLKPNAKGKVEPFCTILRKHCQTNSVGLLVNSGFSTTDALFYSELMLHHLTDDLRHSKKMFKHYFDDSEHNALLEKLRHAFTIHGQHILSNAARLKGQTLSPMVLDVKKEQRIKENAARQQMRQEIKNMYGKKEYAEFLQREVDDNGTSVKKALLSPEGRNQVNALLMELASKQG